MDNTEALAPVYVILTLGVIFMGALLWLAVSDFTNQMTTEVVQPLADDGKISMQTRNGYSFGINLLAYIPVIIIIAIIIFAVIAGIYARDNPSG